MGGLIPTPGRPAAEALPRIIPTLLMDGDGRLVKTVRFKKRTYIGDPINAVKIFNTKEVDELVLLDIDATVEGREPAYDRIGEIAGEAFMPLAYGGGIRSVEQIERLYDVGVEKVVLSSALLDGFDLLGTAAARWGAQAITVCLPYRRNWRGRPVVRLRGGKGQLQEALSELIPRLETSGVGEVILYSIEADGTWSGFDLDELSAASASTTLPVVACGGAGSVEDLAAGINGADCAASAAGSLFVYQAKGRGVLISYPDRTRIQDALLGGANKS